MNTETQPSELAMKIGKEICQAERDDSVYAVFGPETYARIIDRHIDANAMAGEIIMYLTRVCGPDVGLQIIGKQFGIADVIRAAAAPAAATPGTSR